MAWWRRLFARFETFALGPQAECLTCGSSVAHGLQLCANCRSGLSQTAYISTYEPLKDHGEQ